MTKIKGIKKTMYLLVGLMVLFSGCTTLSGSSDPVTQYTRGWNYFQANDFKQAFDWFHRSAMQGYAPAQNGLGVLFANGYYVPSDYHLAEVWFTRAAEQGNAQAQGNLGTLYSEGHDGLPKDLRKAEQWFRSAAAQGDQYAQEQLNRIESEKKQTISPEESRTIGIPKENDRYTPPSPSNCRLERKMSASFFNSTGNWSLEYVCD